MSHFAAVWSRYERAMTRWRRLRHAGRAALLVLAAAGAFTACWVLLGG